MRRMCRFGLILIVATAVALGCTAPRRVLQESPDERTNEVGQPSFFVDWAGFQGPDTLSRLEVYYQVFNFGLQFQKADSEYEAKYVFAVVVDDNDGKQVAAQEQERKVRTAEYGKTNSRFDYRTSQINFALRPGSYRILCSLKDLNSNAITNRDFNLKLRDFRSAQPTASDVEFAHAIDSAAPDSSVFRKGNMAVIPLPSRYYGDEDSVHLQYYFEVYPGRSDLKSVKVEAVIRSNLRGNLSRDTSTVVLNAPVIPQIRELSLDQLPAGEFNMDLKILGPRNRLLDERTESFSLQWTQDALLKHDYKTALAQLKYIDSTGEVKKMEKLRTYEERLAAFNAFWTQHDPTPGTRDNEAKREFYRRVSYASRMFGHLRQPGWRTDRGRIYIVYGEPDQIDDVPMAPNYLPYQVWHYYHQGPYRQFTFVDENEDGDYRLQYPYDGLGMRPNF